MDSSYSRIPQFFKVFLPDHCSQILKIPDEFQVKIAEKIPNKVVIRNEIGKLWPVNVDETGDGLYFKEGWSRFVMDNELKVGEFMTFDYNGHHLFDVIIYGTSGCERIPVKEYEEIPRKANKDNEDFEVKETSRENFRKSSENKLLIDKGEDFAANKKWSKYNAEESQQEIDNAGNFTQENPSFVAKMGQNKHDNLIIPQSLIKDFRLKFGKSIIIEDDQKTQWRKNIQIGKNGQVWITKGRRLLRRWNKIRKHDSFICEFLPGTNETCETMKASSCNGTK